MSDPIQSLVARGMALSLASAAMCASAWAADAAREKDDELPEVTVTAQFVEQNLQETPIAITAVTAEMLEARSQVSVEQIANQAPNVTLRAAGTSTGPSLIGFIRGVGQTDFNPAMEPGVGLYVDDVYFSTLTGSVLDLLDLDRVEVLRGPQGTLSGKNSIGGSIKLYTRRPTGGGRGFVEAGAGNFDALSVRGGSDFTIVDDKLFGRFAGVSRSREGHVTRLDYGCTHPGSGVPVYAVRGGTCELGKEGGISYTAGRLSLRWLASDSVEVNFSADATRDRSEPPANILLAVGPTLLPVGIDTDNNPATGLVGTPLIPLPPQMAGYDILWNAPGNAGACRFIAYGSNSCDPASPNNPYVNYATYTDPRAPGSGGYSASNWTPFSVAPIQHLTAKGASVAVDWTISDDLQLQSITAWREYDSSFADDADGTPLPQQLLLQSIHHKQKSQELRLNGKVGMLVDYTLGGFYFDQDTNEDARVDIPYAGLDFVHGPDLVPAKTKAAFAHGIFHLGERTDLAVGVRQTEETKSYTYARHNPDGTDVPGSPPCPFAMNCSLTGLNGLSKSFKDSRTDFRVALDRQWNEDFMTYVQFATGYKGGGLNPRPFYPQQVLAFDPETIKTYEIGAKSELLERRLRLNVSLFYSDYNDIQLPLNDCTVFAGPGFGIPCLFPANVGSAHVKGGELEFYWYPAAGWQIDGALSKLDFKYTQVDPSTGVPANGISPYTPETKWNLGLQYTFNLASGSSFTPRVDASNQSATYATALNSPTARISGYTLVNARLTWRSPEEMWQVSLEGQNITDKLYFNTKYDLIPAAGGIATGQPGLPRTWMLTLKRNFGG
jgi:iron complex outermembrane recepter protein